jgi:hypothetical protein
MQKPAAMRTNGPSVSFGRRPWNHRSKNRARSRSFFVVLHVFSEDRERLARNLGSHKCLRPNSIWAP